MKVPLLEGPFCKLGTLQGEEEPMAEDEIELPEGATSLDLMQAIYRNSAQPMTRRIRAALIAIAYEHPKLSVNANVDNHFASRMEEIARASGRSCVIDAKARYDTSAPLKIEPPPIQTDPAAGGFKRRF
jgi:hypothetical protein